MCTWFRNSLLRLPFWRIFAVAQYGSNKFAPQAIRDITRLQLDYCGKRVTRSNLRFRVCLGIRIVFCLDA